MEDLLTSSLLVVKAGEKKGGFTLRRLGSGIFELDRFLEGGVPFGAITEFGVPLGREGRFVVLKFIANATRGVGIERLWVLWVSAHEELNVFPSSWLARGVDLERVVFAYSREPLKELKRAIIHPLFKVIVIDSPPRLKAEDCAFIHGRARKNGQAVLLLRDFFLSNKKGNVWARFRLNCLKDMKTGRYAVQAIRGLPEGRVFLDEEAMS